MAQKSKKINGAPERVKSLSAPTRGKTKSKKVPLTVKWTTKSDQFSKQNSKRTEWFTAAWTFSFSDSKSESPTKKNTLTVTKKEKSRLHATTSKSIKWPTKKPANGKQYSAPKLASGHKQVRVHRIGKDVKDLNQNFSRKAFYPFRVTATNKKKKKYEYYRFLKSVKFTLWSSNSFKNATSDGSVSKGFSKSITFAKPDKPELPKVSFDSTSRKWACQIVAAKSTEKKERYDTIYWVDRKQNFGDKKWKDKWGSYIAKTVSGDKKTTFTGGSKVIGLKLDDIDALTYDQYIAIEIHAYSRGLAGRSAEVTKSRYFSYPARGTISSVECIKDVKPDGKKTSSPTGRIVIHMSSNATTAHPVDSVQLMMLHNVKFTSAAEAAASSQWTEVSGVKGVGSTTAFADTYDNAWPDAGKQTWYRIKTTHDHLIRLSEPYRVKDLEHGVGDAKIVEAKVVDDGVNPTGIKLTMGLTDKATGAEVEWSKYKSAINSNKPPDSYQQPLVSSADTTKDLNERNGTNYGYSTVFYIMDLEEGEKYYVSGRRYNETDSGTEYGTRSYWGPSGKVEPILFARKPTEVKMNVPAYIEETATEFEVSWTFQAAVKQKSYTLYAVTPERDSKGDIVKNSDGKARCVENVIMSGNTEQMFATVKSELAKQFIDSGKLVFRVSVSCGGPSAMSSNSDAVLVVRKPSVVLDISQGMPNGIMTAQAPTIRYTVDQKDSKVLLTVRSLGVVMDYPDGDYDQPEGEVLYTGVLNPSSANSPIDFQLPREGMDFLDGGSYEIVATPVGSTGLRGKEVSVRFRVNWEHQAHSPGPRSRVVGNLKDVSATIYTDRPDNWEYGDTCDVYRVTPDGAYPIERDVDFGASVTDPFAPYSKRANLRYRLVTVTQDGDVAWSDVPYAIDAHGIRFDWVGSMAGGSASYKSVTLPYNVKFSDSWTKQFEKVRDMEGGATGWWNPGVDRKATLSTEMIRLGDIENKELVRELAQHPGPVFVRTPNGCAFTANVNVTSFEDDYDSLVSTVSFEAEEIDLVPEFMIQNEV